MPKNDGVDFIAPHKHPGEDLTGLDVFLFPPIQNPEATTADPTTTSATWVDLDEMIVEYTPPSWFPTWEAEVFFTGEFENGGGSTRTGIRIRVDDTTTVPNTNRAESSVIGVDSTFVLTTHATIVVTGGTEVKIAIQWANEVEGAGFSTATGTRRSVQVQFRPFAPVIS